MAIYTTVKRDTGWATIWPSAVEQQDEPIPIEIIGPGEAFVLYEVDSARLSPYDLEARVQLHAGRYVVDDLKMYPRVEYRSLLHIDPTGAPAFSHDEDYAEALKGVITTTGLTKIRLGKIILEGMRREVTVRRRGASGDVVTGVGREEEMARIYCLARAVGENPTKAVAEHYAITSAAAAQRVMRARKAGILPATTKGAR